METGRLIVLTGPSGVGKGTLLKSLLSRHPGLYLSVSATTRISRVGEINGQHYCFVDRKQFENMIATGELLEWAEFAGNYYGTPKLPVIQRIEQGKSVMLEIELEGARQIRQSFPNALLIFILPPSLKELECRLRSRGLDSEDGIVSRLRRAPEEINAASEFNAQIVNDDLETALNQLELVLQQGI